MEIAERQQYEKEIISATTVYENIIEGIVITNSGGVIEKVNNAFTQITGYQSEEAIGKNPRILKSDRHAPAFHEEMWATLLSCGTWEGEIWNRRKNGETYPEWLSINEIKNSEDQITHYVSLFHDRTQTREQEEKIKYQADYDALTGLPNRQLINDRLTMAIASSRRNDFHLGVLFVDLDDFKKINNSHGYYYGDLLLQQVAERLTACCRAEDSVARIAGDKFLLIAQCLRKKEPAAVRLAERISASLKQPFLVNEKRAYLNASIGIAICPDDGNDIESLQKNAEAAMYRAKSQGKNQFHLFTEDLNNEVLRQIALENDLRGALSRDEFVVYYQPQVDLQTGVLLGMEALVRWNRLKKEPLPQNLWLEGCEKI